MYSHIWLNGFNPYTTIAAFGLNYILLFCNVHILGTFQIFFVDSFRSF